MQIDQKYNIPYQDWSVVWFYEINGRNLDHKKNSFAFDIDFANGPPWNCLHSWLWLDLGKFSSNFFTRRGSSCLPIMSLTFYLQPTKLREDNVFNCVCLFAGRGGVPVQGPSHGTPLYRTQLWLPLTQDPGSPQSYLDSFHLDLIAHRVPFPGHVQTCSLCSPYCGQAGSWYSTEMPSCISMFHLLQTSTLILGNMSNLIGTKACQIFKALCLNH